MTIEFEVTKIIRAEIDPKDAIKLREFAAKENCSLEEAYKLLTSRYEGINYYNEETVDEHSYYLYSIDE